jgi:hypothetical protein
MFTAKVHETRATLTGNATTALAVARTALLSLGFEILSDSSSELVAHGPGMGSNREPALLGASELQLQVAGYEVVARATLGGVAALKTFLYLFPPALALALGLGFAYSGMGGWWACLAWALPWLVLSPWLAARLERRTTQAVDRLVQGMAGAGAGRA